MKKLSWITKNLRESRVLIYSNLNDRTLGYQDILFTKISEKTIYGIIFIFTSII